MNSKNYLSENIFLKTLTPIFIGQNQANDLSPYSDFVQVGNEIIYIDEKKFEESLFAKEGLLDKYVKSVRQKIDKSKTQSDFDFKTFIERNIGDVNDFVKVKIPVDQDLKHQTIKRFVNTSGRPFIPGSSIKGAFRTAIIYNWLITTGSGQRLVNELINKVNEINNNNISKLEEKIKEVDITGESKKELNNLKSKRENEKKLSFIYDEEKLFGRKQKENPNGFDSRHIQISDSNPFRFENISVLKLHRIKLRDNSEVSPLPSETLNPNSEGNFTFKLEKHFVQPDLTKFNSISLNDINKILNEFSLTSINYELDSFNEFHDRSKLETGKEKTDYSECIDFYELLKTKIENSKNEYAILRLGSGKTFFDNSIGLALYNSDKDLFKKYRELLELGKNPISKKLVLGRFPTTRTLVEATKLPIGWVAISVNKNSIESLSLYESKIIPVVQNINPSSQINQATIQQKKYTLAEIVDDKTKPPKVKILDGEHSGKETILPGVRLESLGLKNGSKVYVDLVLQKKILQKADYKRKSE